MAFVVYGTGHIKSPQGILKVVEIVFCLIGLLLVVIHGWSNDLQNAYIVGTTAGIIVSSLMLLLYITKIAETIEKVLSYQCFLYAAWFIYLLITSSVLISRVHQWNDQKTAGGAFGLLACFTYLGDAIVCYMVEKPQLMFL